MELERVARRLAVDQGYRRRAAEGLCTAAGSGGAGASDVLHRVRRLNDYLSTGLALLDDDPAAARGPLPWEQHAAAAEQQPEHPQQPQKRSPVASSPEDSDIEEEEGGQDGTQAVAALLAEAQAAVQRRQAAAALTIQCAFRRHRAQTLLQQLRERRLAADRLVARALAAAYRGVCGSRRALALQAALRQLRRLRRWRLRRRLRAVEQLVALDADEAAAANEVQQERPQQDELPVAVSGMSC
ncbi:hypothetical protein C2E21_8954 [Chlorella sorokiniana]|uniref:Uncharacterized protein n=1 Tax=Chlorella sorokiniana TaxID=3076 RepID=A0A2P6TCV2_CHLSO|nr:hypothetical protein C2E21_8954 [Chlorella sorokiniana]|eukprot:PRW20480.1 hypothetical protein C2E21_8954 [Chlorella sorokiniana]